MTDGGPLDGIVVVDLSRALAGPHAAMMLGDLGARVIKVEAPDKGDDTRNWGPPFVTPDEGDRESTYFLSCNRNKESITLDLKSEDGARTLGRLVRHADVLVENFRTGVLDRLGYGMPRLTELNPRLVVLSITGFGHDGPEGGRAGYDQIAQGEAGIMSVTGPLGGEPTRVGVPIGDLLAGMYGAYGVVAALHDRERTGHGQIVRTSLLAALVGVHAFQGTMYTVGGVVQIAVGSESLWRAFAPAFGLDRPQWATNPERVADRDAVGAAIDAAFAPSGRAELMAKLAELGIPAGQVRSIDEVYAWEQTRSQGLLVDVDHSTLGAITLPGPPLRFDTGGRARHAAPPVLGEHNESVRAWLDRLDGSGR
jgi:crotonobetainyl-CoA:carnitine CoA-transferase CaiB-like acyl-CoA transferase